MDGVSVIAGQHVGALPRDGSEISEGVRLKQGARLELIRVVRHVQASGSQRGSDANAHSGRYPELPLGRRALSLPDHSGIDKARKSQPRAENGGRTPNLNVTQGKGIPAGGGHAN